MRSVFTLYGPQRTCLITGASSGIGEQYAWKLAAELGHNVVLVARRSDRLEALATRIRENLAGRADAPFVTVLPLDLTAPEAPEHLLAVLRTLPSPVNVVINNAGFGTLGDFAESDLSRQLAMVELNCSVPLTLMRLLLPQLIARRGGLVINVASTAAFQPLTYMSTYGATKAFLCSLTVAVGAEVASQGVHLMAHCPGPTATEFHLAAGLPAKIDLLNSMSVKTVVDQAVRAAERGRRIVVNGRLNLALAQLSRMLPPSIVAAIVGRMLRPYAELDRRQRQSGG